MGMIMRCGYWVLCVFCRDVYGEECLLGIVVALQAIHNHCCRIYFCVKGFVGLQYNPYKGRLKCVKGGCVSVK